MEKIHFLKSSDSIAISVLQNTAIRVTACLKGFLILLGLLLANLVNAESSNNSTTLTTEKPKTDTAASITVTIKQPTDEIFSFNYPLKGGLFITAPAPLESIPHNPSHFTQGLVYDQGLLYESTGLYGQSSLVALDAKTGAIKNKRKVPKAYFAEGLALHKDKLYQLTWKKGKAFIYNTKDFSLIDTKSYQGEGWGAAFKNGELHMTDGSDKIIKITNIENFNKNNKTDVKIINKSIKNLNEIEFINDYLWANIWQTNNIAVINPDTGKVQHIIRFDLPLKTDSYIGQDVLNGIAYNNKNGDIYITGKLFKKIYKYNIEQFM